ncbi:MAG TPA: dickkopf-related protein [Polyangiaceae bacterium]|nr:MAG: hypothetical protein BWY17_03620 [Deltaproteobacteria bacterium ADurb.Bin207]HNS98364.1 dickkopf-related protein [Polyangiaceae bacterium]HOD23947.1 dickkopf-related protein [Polyangiaceae bacterium]HOE51278.1 dickkopf-related protein [Polyangiaceae bacterium]HOH03111.1 dickkopf-related protein [Polyangiaceae bacterium]
MLPRIVACVVVGWALAGCSADSDSQRNYGHGGSSAAGASGGGGGTLDSGTTVPEADTPDTLSVNPEASTDVFVPDGDSCLKTSAAAEPFPLDMYVMMDQSGSMSMPVNLMQPLGETQWGAVKKAFVGFLNDPATPTGMSMGIQYFPLPIAPWEPLECSSETDCASGSICVKLDNGKHCVAKCTSDANCPAVSECMSFDDGNGGTLKFCSNDSCDVSAYATPEVPIAPIPSVNAEILASLNAHSPLTMTPSAPALEGAIQYARSWATQHPGHTTIVIFATDGQPTACSKAAFPINEVKSIAAAGVNGSPSIRTFVIGVLSAGAGPLGNSLHEVAKAGGTNQALIVQVNQDMTAQFKAALEAIRGAFMQCEFQVPNPGIPMDYDEVNVVYTAPNGEKFPVYYVGSLADCDPNMGGWFYDTDPKIAEPTKILLCPQSCQFMQAHSGSIDIEIGCKTITPPK